MTTIHNGMLDVDSSLRADPAISPPRMIMVARFEAQKDHETLFRALDRLKHLEWRLDLVGGGPDEERFKSLANELGLAGRITFHGHSADVARLLARSQIFLLITNWEGFPRSTLEAMRAGLPSIVTDVGGNREAFATGAEGVAVPHRSVGELAAAVERLVSDPAMRAEMGARARRTYEEHFTFEIMYRRYLAEYRRLLGR
jgi:glycosyltransferase involved in cell wall biosynthesis